MISFIWCLLILAAPIFWKLGGMLSKVSFFIYYFFSSTCHQLEDRSFHIFGQKLGVCSRCTSIYLGFLIGTIIYPFYRRIDNKKLPSLWFLMIAAFLLLIDSSFEIIQFRDNTFFSRTITGFILGYVLTLYLIPGFVNFIQEVVSFFKNNTKEEKIKQ
jgi:uncharacterized membrane protein